ncbi:hypothetical protein [Mycoplasma sp. P36-A1]|uniref:hypothetical protein n=1 Tax=Mycoplasma sp. P36-A1 TaxID=3252900 RepID=UPI003C3049C8
MKKILSVCLLILVLNLGCSNNSSNTKNLEDYKKKINELELKVNETNTNNIKEKLQDISGLSNKIINHNLDDVPKNIEDKIDIKLMQIIDLTAESKKMEITLFKESVTKVLTSIKDDLENATKN